MSKSLVEVIREKEEELKGFENKLAEYSERVSEDPEFILNIIPFMDEEYKEVRDKLFSIANGLSDNDVLDLNSDMFDFLDDHTYRIINLGMGDISSTVCGLYTTIKELGENGIIEISEEAEKSLEDIYKRVKYIAKHRIMTSVNYIVNNTDRQQYPKDEDSIDTAAILEKIPSEIREYLAEGIYPEKVKAFFDGIEDENERMVILMNPFIKIHPIHIEEVLLEDKSPEIRGAAVAFLQDRES